jgi:hypothetical protein
VEKTRHGRSIGTQGMARTSSAAWCRRATHCRTPANAEIQNSQGGTVTWNCSREGGRGAP